MLAFSVWFSRRIEEFKQKGFDHQAHIFSEVPLALVHIDTGMPLFLFVSSLVGAVEFHAITSDITYR